MLFLDYLAILYLFLFSLYHIVQGIISVFFPDSAIKFNKFLYGFELREKKQLKLSLRPWGSFAFVIGIIGFIVLFNIEEYSLILIAFTILLSFRVGYRILLYNQLKKLLKLTKIQNWRMIIVQVIGIVLFVLFLIRRL